MWLWELKDLAVVGVGLLLSVLALAALGFLLPLVLTVLYAFLSIRMEDASKQELEQAIFRRHHSQQDESEAPPALPISSKTSVSKGGMSYAQNKRMRQEQSAAASLRTDVEGQ